MNRVAERYDGFTLKTAKGKSLYELYDFINDCDESTSPNP